MATRLLSQSEVRQALSCQARWDFRYGGHLAGTALRPKRVTPLLSGGRAWGAAVGAYHVLLGDQGKDAALEALDASLDADALSQQELGLYDREAHEQLRERLTVMLAHYVATAEPFRVAPDLEHEFVVPIPSRSGKRASNAYRLHGFIDAYRPDGPWLVEFKLRGRLVPVQRLQLDRQIRWYAWAWWQQSGMKVRGVEVVERLNEAPKPPRILKSGKPSHAKDQLCTADAYRLACRTCDEPVNPETEAALEARRWQQRVPIVFRDGELEEAGREMVSAAALISQLDAGKLVPLRNPGAQCDWCEFREICPAPDDQLVDSLYERQPPKRDRQTTEEAT